MVAFTQRAALLALLGAAVVTAQDNPFKPFDQAAFETHAKSLGADDAALAKYREAIGDVGLGTATDELLQDLVPTFGEAVELALDGEPNAAVKLAALIAGEDRYVRAHSRYHLGRVFVDADDPENAVSEFALFLQQDRNLTPLDSEAAFFYASALADIPMPQQAVRAFTDYIELFPEAPERYRAVALQRKAELEAQFENPLHGIADQMKVVERDLKKAKTGKPVQTEQLEIVTKLKQIIEEMEKQEQQQSSGAPNGNSQPSGPAGNSALPPGASRVGSLQSVPNVADRWGDMKDRDRKEIEAEVQNKLPGRYRKLLEDYYRKLSRSQRP